MPTKQNKTDSEWIKLQSIYKKRPNASLLREIAQNVPRERVLVETDAPYLSPEPYRGKKNEPAMVKYVVDCLAELWNESPEQVAKVTTSNFFRLFEL